MQRQSLIGVVLQMQSKFDPRRILQEVLSIPSINGSDGELILCRYLESLFNQFGITNQIVMTSPKRANLIASIEGTAPESSIVLNGHLDTVPYGNLDDWNTPPDMPIIQDGHIFCRGASDMKSGLAAMASAMCWLSENKIKPQSSLYFLATCDEERNGEGALWARKQEFMRNASFLLIAEPTDNRIALAEKGCIWLKLVFKGKASHSAYPEEGASAFEYGCHFISRLQDFLLAGGSDEFLGQSTMVVTQSFAGIADNMVPDKAEFHLDIRTLPKMQFDSIIDEINELVSWLHAKEPQIEVSYEVVNKRVALKTAKDNQRIQDFLSCVPGVKEFIGINYYTDASLLNEDNRIPFLIFGPGYLNQMHKSNESCNLKYYDFAYHVYRTFLNKC